MENTTNDQSLNHQRTHLSPRDFAENHHINVQNVYYWIRKQGYGRKDGKRWLLSPEDQQAMLELEAARPDGKKFAKQPHSRAIRKRATESVGAIKAKLDVDDRTAKLIRLLIDHGMAEPLFSAFEEITEYRCEYRNTFQHEKVLLLIAKFMGYERLGALTIRDGYPFYKFVEIGNPEQYTVVYNIPNQIYYIDQPGKILREHGELEIARQTVRL